MSITKSLFNAWNFRHACKEFDPSYHISDADINTILEAGRLSPSSFGFEPWQFLIIQNKELREELLPICWGAQGQLPTASHFIIFLARLGKAMNPKDTYIRETIMRDTQKLPDEVAEMRVGFFENFIEHDLAYAGNERAKFEWAARQCYIALGNMMTTAALLEIDSCPMEGFKKAEVENLLASKNLLNKESHGVAVMLGLGKRVKEPHQKTRRSMEQVVQWVK